MNNFTQKSRASLLPRYRLALATTLMAAGISQAQITTDGTMGAAQALAGPDFVIPQTLGTLSGRNLFHSFLNFNINTGENATFTATSALDNVISRVTGGETSFINGGLFLDAVGSPAFFFLNPAGVMFGEGASVSVPGAFRVSTGDYLLFADGNIFDADPNIGSSISSAAPEAFGFLGANSSLLSLDSVDIGLDDGEGLSLVAGDTDIINSTLSINGGRVNLTTVGTQAIEVLIEGESAHLPSGGATGVTVIEESTINVGGDGAGVIRLVSAGALSADFSNLLAQNTGDLDATGFIDIFASDIRFDNGSVDTNGLAAGTAAPIRAYASSDMVIADSNIGSNSLGAGDAGLVQLQTGTLTLDTAFVLSEAYGEGGNASAVQIFATGDVTIINDSIVASSTFSDGNAGGVFIDTQSSLAIAAGASIESDAEDTENTTGDAGAIVLQAAGNIELADGGTVSSETYGGNGGYVAFSANNLTIDDSEVTTNTREGSSGGFQSYIDIQVADTFQSLNNGSVTAGSASDAQAGYITIQAADVTLESGSILDSSTFSAGNAGTITIASNTLTIDASEVRSEAEFGSTGDAGSVVITTSGSTEVLNGGLVASATAGGNGGRIEVTAGSLTIDGGSIQNDAVAGSTGVDDVVSYIQLRVADTVDIRNSGAITASSASDLPAGYIDIQASDVTLEAGADIDSSTFAVGNAGAITITSDSLTVDNSVIRSEAEPGSSGDAGFVTIDTSGTTEIVNGGLLASATYGGNGGTVLVTAENLTMDGGKIETNAFAGSAGDFQSYIEIQVDDAVEIRNHSAITASTASGLTAGYIDIQAADVTLENGAEIDSSTSGTGNAGQITIAANNVNVDGGNSNYAAIFSESDLDSGDAGSISINATNSLDILTGGTIVSTSSGGSAGSVTLAAQNLTIDGGRIETDALEDSSGDFESDIQIRANDTLSLLNSGLISATTRSDDLVAGSITLEANNIVLQNSVNIDSSTYSDSDAGTISLLATDTVLLQGGALVDSNTYASGDAGSVTIDGADVVIDSEGSPFFTAVRSEAAFSSTGDAGNIGIFADNNLTINGAGAVISSDTHGVGHAGQLYLQASDIEIDAGQLVSVSRLDSTGNAGDIYLVASGHTNIVNDAGVSSSTFSSGNAGSISIDSGSLTAETSYVASAAEFGSSGDAGAVVVTTDSTTEIVSSTLASATSGGNGGTVTINAKNLTLDGGNVKTDALEGSVGDIRSDIILRVTETISISNGGTVGATTASDSNAGYIDILATTVNLNNNADIDSSTFSSGNAGFINIAADELTVDGGDAGISVIRSEAEQGSSGNAGSITIDTINATSILNGGLVASTTFGGNGGSVTITAKNLTIDGGNVETDAFEGSSGDSQSFITFGVDESVVVINNGLVSATTLSELPAGEINITTLDLTVQSDSAIDSSTESAGNAGTINIAANNLLVETGASITSRAEADSSGIAGSIGLTIVDTVSVLSGGEIGSSSDGSGAAGSIAIVSTDLFVDGGEIQSAADSANAAGAGSVGLLVSNSIDIANSGLVSSSNSGPGAGGSVIVQSNSLSMDTLGSILSETLGEGLAGIVDINVATDVVVDGGALISSSTAGSGPAGFVSVIAKTLLVDGGAQVDGGGIVSRAEEGSSGDAGDIEVQVTDGVSVVNGGLIGSSSDGSGEAGSVIVTASTLLVDEGGSIKSAADRVQSRRAGSVDLIIADSVVISNGGTVSASNRGPGDGGNVLVEATSLQLDGGSRGFATLESEAFGTGNAGSVIIEITDDVSIENGAVVTSSTFGIGDAGTVSVIAASLTVDGGLADSASIESAAFEGSSGDGGEVEVRVVGDATIVNGGGVSSSTFGSGKAGTVKIGAANLLIDGTASIETIAGATGTGEANDVTVEIVGNAILSDGGTIASSTFTGKDAGTVSVTASNLTLDSTGSNVSFIDSSAGADSRGGNAGSVVVDVSGQTSVLNGSLISSSTFSTGRAGSVSVNTKGLTIDGEGDINPSAIRSQAQEFSTGNAGRVNVTVDELATISNGGQISTSALLASEGNAGNVTVTAADLVIKDAVGSINETGIFSEAGLDTLGNAGNITVDIKNNASLEQRGVISSATLADGNAGTVNIAVGNSLTVAGAGSEINARAGSTSQGQTGSVTVSTGSAITLRDSGAISIRNEATSDQPGAITPTTLSLTAPTIFIVDNAEITASSTGNVSASNIVIEFGDLLEANLSSITTSAADGNGGTITISGDNLFHMIDAQLTTSVLGQTGNGGDININLDTLLMESGFIRANTAAAGATGGNVNIDVQRLITSGASLALGGDADHVFVPGIFGFNVIQAAAPDGVTGDISISAPELDLSASLGGLGTSLLDAGGPGRDPCGTSGGSSVSWTGRGGMPPTVSERPAIVLGGAAAVVVGAPQRALLAMGGCEQ